LDSVIYCTEKEKTKSIKHHLTFFDDKSTENLKDFLKLLKNKVSNKNIYIEIVELREHGIMSTIGACYEYLRNFGTHLVYQVQDDYLHDKSCIYEMIDVFNQIKEDSQSDCFIYPYNRSELWKTSYKNRSTPRAIFYGEKRPWIQIYDVSCCLFTSVEQLRQNKDITDLFLSLPPKGINGDLEAISLNYIFTRRGQLCITPIQSLSLHVQGENDKDPYINWKEWWDDVSDFDNFLGLN
jgi:hypothetical protein